MLFECWLTGIYDNKHFSLCSLNFETEMYTGINIPVEKKALCAWLIILKDLFHHQNLAHSYFSGTFQKVQWAFSSVN